MTQTTAVLAPAPEALPPLGVLAGGGALPRLVVEACLRVRRSVHVIGFAGHAVAEDYRDCPFTLVRLGAMGRVLRILKRLAIDHIVMAGHVRRPSLLELRPDTTALAFLMETGARSLGDDGLLATLICWLESRRGFTVLGVEALLGPMTHPIGPLGACRPDDAAVRDIEKGRAVLAILGAADIGQALVVQDGLILGIEAVEGTDALLRRCAALRRPGPGGVLVKMRKPGQERRADLPVIGPETVRVAASAGVSGIALDAGGSIVLEQAETVGLADARRLFLYAMPSLSGDAREAMAE